MPLSEVQLGERILAGLKWQPSFGLIVGIGEIDAEVDLARRTLASLRAQAYGAWGATIVRRGQTVPARLAERLLHGFEDIANRVHIRLETPATASLAGLIRSPVRQSPINLIGVLLAGDVLGCDALLEMAIASGLQPDAELFYSDEWRVSPASHRTEAFFKPRWSPDLLLATNYIGRFWCTLPSVLRRARPTMGEWFQFGDYDLALRCTEVTLGICHVPKLLCERGRAQLDHPDQERASLLRAMQRRGIEGELVRGAVEGHYRVRRAFVRPSRVSIIVATWSAQGRIESCIKTLRARTHYRDFEIICVENVPAERGQWKSWIAENADTVVTVEEPFNWSRFNNLGAKQASGEFLLFLNDDVEIIESEWLDALVEHAQRPEIGVVGARLLYPNRTVQHAGIFWTPQGGRHAFRGVSHRNPGYFGMAVTQRDVLAVTGACFMVRREQFEALAGFDECHSLVNGDVDFCLRCAEAGKSIIYTPHSRLLHHEGVSRIALDDGFSSASFERRWGRKLQMGDPYYHPALSQSRDDYAYHTEPQELVYSGHPLFAKTSLRSILLVKLDHIGDFVTSIPAVQRLQQHFPQARLFMLAPPGTLALGHLVPGLFEIIEFEFFFARSGLGQRQLSEPDIRLLRERLEPYRFDLAADLRKAPETRPILLHTGARWLAGFDRGAWFPWLDVVVEWEADAPALRKRGHVSEDLLRLADAIANATEPNVGFQPVNPSRAAARAALPQRKFVCIHPGVGSPIRQWPVAYFAMLIDLLTATYDIEIVLIGSSEETDIAADIMGRVHQTDLVRSLVGQILLEELPELLASAALFVGNNSGPQHIAARLGVPTIGIHSGTVDAREWGPVGSEAVAIRRNMICSPCYFSDASDCPRELACLTELRPFEVYELCRRLLSAI